MKKSTAPPPLFLSLPDEIATDCLARVSKSQYSSLSSVSKSFHSLLSSPEIHAARSQVGATEPRLYLRCESLRTATTTTTSCYSWYNLMSLRNCDDDEIIKKRRWLCCSRGEIKINRELRLVPVKNSSFQLRSRSKEASLAVGSEIYQFGGINEKGKRCSSVRVLDCLSHTQHRAPKMRVAREGAKACLFDGSIYVMGGCREKECWGEVFNIKSQTWFQLPSPSGGDEFDCNKFEVLVLGARIYVITERDKYAYDPKQGRWLLLDMGFVDLKYILKLSMVWCVLDNLLFREFCARLFWYDLSSGNWLEVEGLTDLLYTKVECLYRMVQLVSYGGKLVIVWVVLPDIEDKVRTLIPEERIWFAVIRLEKRLTSSGLSIWGEIEELNYLVHGSCNPLTCLSVLL